MDAGNMKHEWVNGFRNFELVMQCLNELPSWDSDQTVRAFQTHSWADATPQASDAQNFSHEATSVSVQFDGGTLAVEFAGLDGMNSMREAFADLFPALYDLGWRRAEVYHSPATMPELLGDMGASIPAHMDFDLVAAEISDELSGEGDGTGDDAIGFGSRLMAAPVPHSRDGIVLDQMLNLGEDVDASMPNNTPTDSRTDFGPIVLEDDVGATHGTANDLFSETVTIASPHSRTTKSINSAGFDDDDERPQVFSLASRPAGPTAPGSASASRSFAPAHDAPHADQEQMLTAALPALPSIPSSVSVKVVDVGTIPVAVQQGTRIAPVSNPIAANADQNPKGCPESVLILGSCAFYFELTTSPHEDKLAEDFAQGFDEIIRLRPGQLNPAVRWDVLAEIDPEFPWLAEQLAEWLIGESPTTAFMASRLLEAKNSRDDAQLRDLTRLIASSQGRERSEQEDPADDYWHQVLGDALDRHQDALVMRMAGLLLPGNGAAFVDVRPRQVTPAGASPRSISVKALARSATTTFVYVQVDPLDGPSVRRVAFAMEQLVLATRGSRRQLDVADVQITTQARAIHVDAIKAEVRAEVKAEMGQVLSQFLERLDAKA